MYKQSWYVYIVRCADDSLYTGITKDILRRIDEHNTDDKSGAAYTHNRRPVTLVYQESYATRSAAARREHKIKQMDKKTKEAFLHEIVRSGTDRASPIPYEEI